MQVLDIIPPILDEDSDAVGLLPNAISTKLEKFKWLIKPVDGENSKKSIYMYQQNGKTHLMFHSSGFGCNLWAVIKSASNNQFYFEFFKDLKGLPIGSFTIDGTLEVMAGGTIYIKSESKVVWSEGNNGK